MTRATRATVIAAAVLIAALFPRFFPAQSVNTLPDKLSDAEFWQLSSTLSEPDGYFHSDNFVSNERSFQHVLSALSTRTQPGTVYIGVGPEQNFTYLLAVKPRIAFIVDIRRQNLLEHLMYKALFEMSKDRADFLSFLFSRPRPTDVNSNSSVDALFESFNKVRGEPELMLANLKAIRSHLTTVHGFAMSAEDQAGLERIYLTFSRGAGNLTYDGPIQYPGIVTGTGVMPTFEELMRETDKEGSHRSFLATEENFRTIQALHNKNLLVPIVGNFAGSSALRAVGQYVRDHGATIAAFYTSNVEQYLFMDESWKSFYSNVSTLPVTERSVFIRGLIRSASGQLSSSPALPLTSHYETGLFSIADLAAAFKSGSIRNYYDILADQR
jgi:hypothetical protein